MRKAKIDAIYARLKEATKTPCIKLEPYKKASESLTESKIGGLPYLPLEGDMPRDEKGEAMYLLAQINCEELPKNEIYPDKGLVQFWLGEDEDNYLYGLDFEAPTKQKNWRILYYETFEVGQSFEEVKNVYKPRYEASPLEVDEEGNASCFALRFSETESVLPLEAEAFGECFIRLWNEAYPEDKLEGELYEALSEDEHEYLWELTDEPCSKIGGYANFTQWDARKAGSYKTLLLQLDTEDCIMWGDSGIGNFFIENEAKQTADFSNVFYNWDCY